MSLEMKLGDDWKPSFEWYEEYGSRYYVFASNEPHTKYLLVQDYFQTPPSSVTDSDTGEYTSTYDLIDMHEDDAIEGSLEFDSKHSLVEYIKKETQDSTVIKEFEKWKEENSN
jgi:hypothetical protein